MNKLYIGIDNGVSGSIGCIYNNKTWFFESPIKSEQNYTKKKANITRINFPELSIKLSEIISECNPESIMCLIERPMVDPTRFISTTSALRSLESTLCVLELLDIPLQYEDSKKWQKLLLPNGCKGEELKTVSKDIGCRLFPQHKELIIKHKDADGILLAEYCRRNF
jgi:hypothetical protein